MQLNPFCICCQLNKQEKKIRGFSDSEKKLIYMKEIMNRYVQAGENDCAPSLSVEFADYFSSFWNVPAQDYTEIKKEFNRLMLALENELTETVQGAEDPLAAALRYARIGNYIDFAALAEVDKDQLLSLIREDNSTLDPREYALFREELSDARSLVYLTDNCGEIVLDKIAVKMLQKLYPHLSITVIVRGEPVVNDATMEDAAMCGLTELVPVIGNGSRVGGTWLPDISEEARQLLDRADVIIAKGQGNFETLNGCGLNIYYLFLCKCDWFVRLFNAKPLEGMFVNERRVTPLR